MFALPINTSSLIYDCQKKNTAGHSRGVEFNGNGLIHRLPTTIKRGRREADGSLHEM